MTIIVLLIAMGFALGVTPMIRELAIRLRFVAVPRNNRAHRVATPLMGGVALYLAFTIAIIALAVGGTLLLPEDQLDATLPISHLLIVLACGTLVALVGLWDDWADLPSHLKLGLQVVPVIFLVFSTDIRINMPIPDVFNILLTLCWFLYIINAVNYMDNMDGVASMTAGVAAMFFTVVTIINGQFLIAALSAAVTGVAFGFLRYNLFEVERKIFMGDVGALFLGFLLAFIGLRLTFPAESPWVTWPVPVLILGVPVFDTALVFFSRWRRKEPFLNGGTDHLSHRLARLEFGRYGVPFAIGMLGSALGCAALLIMHSSLVNSLAAQIFVGLCALYLLYKLELRASHRLITGAEPTPPPADMLPMEGD
jgi:UDP-GlcNAc:undecaprenyl-phosphate/decaprenyl-phosphate GlcNAc-1-phosphate transferase